MCTRLREYLLIGCCIVWQGAVFAGVDDCLRLLEKHVSSAEADQQGCRNVLIQEMSRPQSILCEELLRRMKNNSTRLETRLAALDIVTVGVPASCASEFVETLHSIGEQSAVQGTRQADNHAARLLNQFATSLSSVPKEIQRRKDYLDVLAQMATNYVCSREAQYAALNMIPKSEAPLGVRRTAAMRIIRKWAETRPLVTLMPLLDRESESELLREFSDDLEDGQVRYGLAATLAYRGVAEASAVLEKAVKLQSDIRKQGILSEYLWQIDVQQRPDGLADFIANAWPREDIVRVAFALRRSVETGVPRDRIRQSLFKLAERAPDGDRLNTRAMSQIKRLAIELGVLSKDDLPWISVVPVPGLEW